MKIYTVLGMHKIDYDFSVEIFKLGCFMSAEQAIQKAKEEFEKAMNIDFASDIKRYSNEDEYPDVDCGALEIERDDENGYYCFSFGFEQDYEVYSVAVDEWEVE